MTKTSKATVVYLKENAQKAMPRVIHAGPAQSVEMASNGIIVKREGKSYWVPNANVLAIEYVD